MANSPFQTLSSIPELIVLQEIMQIQAKPYKRLSVYRYNTPDVLGAPGT